MLATKDLLQTTYHRSSTGDNAKAKQDNNDKASTEEKESISASSENNTLKKPSYLSQLKIWHGTFSDESIVKIFLRPFPFLLSPVVGVMPS